MIPTVSKISLSNDAAKVEYSTDAGSFKMSLSRDLAPLPLIESVKAIVDIFASRLMLDDADHINFVRPTGLEVGGDDKGDWFRISGIYTVNNIEHKLITGKMRRTDFLMSENQDPDDYPYLLADDEMELVEYVIEKAEEFAKGARAQRPQLELALEEDEEAVEVDEA